MNIPEDWWVDFFNGPCGELQVMGERLAAAARDVDRIVTTIGPAPLRILDAPCGAGRHALDLARRGYDVVGVDFNPNVLESAHTTAQTEGLELALQQHDLRQLAFDSEFDAVLCLWTSIGYFSDEDNEPGAAEPRQGHQARRAPDLGRGGPREPVPAVLPAWLGLVGRRRQPHSCLRGTPVGCGAGENQRALDLLPRWA